MGAANPNWWFITAGFFVGQFVQLVFIVFLTFELFFKHTLDNIGWFYDELVEYKVGDVGVAIAQMLIWYYVSSLGVWSFLLSVNRFTAIAYPWIHFKIWTGKSLCFIFGITAVFPFMVEGFTFADIHCRLYAYVPECRSFKVQSVFIHVVCNISLSIAALIIVTTAVIKAPKQNTILAKIERKSILYTVATSICIIGYSVCFYICRLTSDTPVVLYNVSMMFYLCHQYGPMILLLFLNSIYRREFFKFLKLDRLGIVRNQTTSIAAVTMTTKHS